MITLAVVALVGVVVGVVVGYLFMRANPDKKAVVDKFADEQSDNLKK